ncbi:MAG: virulence factor [Actinomycetota bacterium]|nr:virulence factor [Actinomycetota bacterium]
MPRGANEVVVIMWRDIPAQVNSQVGRDRHQLLLPAKFQRAIDRAKRKAGIDTAQDDVAQWRRVSRPLDGDPVAAARAEADRIEAEYSRQRLGMLAFAGGWEGDVEAVSASTADLAALEELDDSEEQPQAQEQQ